MNHHPLCRPTFPELTADVIDRIGGFYNAAGIALLKEADSLIYEATSADGPLIIRVSHGQRRARAQIEAELAWLRHLRDSGADVCAPRPARQGHLTETLCVDDAAAPSDAVQLVVAAFDRIPGRNPRRSDPYREVYEPWGRVVGRIHAVAARAEGEGRRFDRPHWHQEPSLALGRLVPEQREVVQRTRELIDQLGALPVDRDCYGLVHGDLHEDNLHLHQGRVILYDFDDSHYGWFASDIARVIYYARWYCPEGQSMGDYLRCIVGHFLTGYRRERAIDGHWLARIPLFLELYRLIMYGNKYRNWFFSDPAHPKLKGLARHRKEIVEREPMIPIDCGQL